MISDNAKEQLTIEQHEFIHVIGSLKGENVYKSAFTIAVHSRVFDMLFNNVFNYDYLSDIILTNTENPIVNRITADYVMKGYEDFTELEEFVRNKINELHH